MKIVLDRQLLLGVLSVSIFSYAIYTTFLKNSKFFKKEEKKVVKKVNKTLDANKTKSISKAKIEKGMILYLKYKCNNNNSSYCNELAKIDLQQNKNKKALKFFAKSCALKNVEGCFYSASLNINKKEKNLEEINEIINNLEFSCNNNFAASCNILANLNLKYFDNKQKAIKLLEKSCKLKNNFACSKLKELEKK